MSSVLKCDFQCLHRIFSGPLLAPETGQAEGHRRYLCDLAALVVPSYERDPVRIPHLHRGDLLQYTLDTKLYALAWQ